jgi:hypothetical protein
MAVQPSAGRSVPLFVLIIFVVLFLAATTGLVLLFVHQETVKQEANQKSSDFDNYVGRGLTSRLDSYKAMGASTRKTAVAALLDDRDELARLLTGNKGSTAKEATDKLDKMISGLQAPAPAVARLKEIAKSDLVGGLQQATKILETQMSEMAALQQQFAECQKNRDTVTAGYKDLETQFQTKTTQFLTQLQALEKLFESYKKEYAEQLDTIKTQVSKDLQDKLVKMGKTFNLHVDELRDMVRRNLQLLIKATTEVGPAELRSASSLTVEQLTQKADGEVMDIAGPVVYISLGSKQGVKPGMRFCVISGTLKGDVTPKVKGVVEVTNVGELTGECRVIKSLPANPVIKGDSLLNLVYDKDIKLTFFVLGEFDLNKDGTIDPAGASKVTEIILLSGGKISKQLSPTVNFVVLGSPPEKSSATGVEQETDKQTQKTRMYNDLRDQIQALNVPVINPDLFLKYTGYTPKLD